MATANAIPSNANIEHRSLPQETPPEELVLFVELLAANVIFAVYITAMGVVFCSMYAPTERSLSTPRLNEYNREPVGDSSLWRRRCISQGVRSNLRLQGENIHGVFGPVPIGDRHFRHRPI
jgi:hypothetical protein